MICNITAENGQTMYILFFMTKVKSFGHATMAIYPNHTLPFAALT